MMIYPSVAAIAYDQGLEAKDFYLDIHKRIYTAMQDISDAGKPIDVTTLVSRLQDLEQLNLVGGADYIITVSYTHLSLSCEVQCGQRVASNAISVLQKGHVFVVGSFSTSASLCTLEARLFMVLTRIKIINAIIRKLRTSVRKVP